MTIPTGWENAGRIDCVIDSSKFDDSVTGYVVAVNFSSSSGTGSKDLSRLFDLMVYADRKKCAFALADGVQCLAECECWDDTNKIATYHVKLGSDPSASDLTLSYYFDPEGSENTTYIGDTGSVVAQSVWPSNHIGVWHMAQAPTGGAGCILDSTSNANHGTPAGSMTSGDLTSGPVGKGLDFDGTDDLIFIDASALNAGLNDICIEVVLKIVTLPGAERFAAIAGKGFLYSLEGYGILLIGSENKFTFQVRDASTPYQCMADNVYTADTQYVVAGCVDRDSSTGVYMFINGAKQTATADPTPLVANSLESNADFTIAARDTVASYGFYSNVIVSSVRRYNTVLSDAWLKANSYNLKDSLITFSDITYPYKVSGTVQEGGTNVARTIRVYDHADGSLLGETTSDVSDGSFEIDLLTNDECYVVAFDNESGDDYNALIFSGVTPVSN